MFINKDGYATDLEPWTPTSVALESFVKKFKLPKSITLTGGSGRGWSYFGSLQQCPRKFRLRYVDKREGEDEKPARDVGSIFHAFMALGYSKDPIPVPTKLRDYLITERANPYSVETAWRVYDAYVDYYQDDYLRALAVEYTARDPRKRSCRYDLIAEVEPNNAEGILPGIYVVEHKTTAAFTQDFLDGWDLDGEVLGQIALWPLAGLDKVFGPLRGVIVNIAGKQKTPQFYRAIVSTQSLMTRTHLKVLDHLEGLEKNYAASGYYPPFMNNCIHRFGKCDYYEHCRNPEVNE